MVPPRCTFWPPGERIPRPAAAVLPAETALFASFVQADGIRRLSLWRDAGRQGADQPRPSTGLHEGKVGNGMLVLSRKVNEEVTIRHPESGEDVVVLRVVAIEGGKVRLGFDTPAAFLDIVRNELLERQEAYVARKPLPR